MTFRSIQMAHFRLIIPRQNIYPTIQKIIQLQNTHIVDISHPLHRPFFSQIKRCDQLLQKIENICDVLKQYKLVYDQYDHEEINYVDNLQLLWKKQIQNQGISEEKLLDYIENDIIDNWQHFYDITQRLQKLKQNRKNYLEKIACYEGIISCFGEKVKGGMDLMRNDFQVNQGGISTIVGVIPPDLELKLSRTIYRVSRGYACYKTVDRFQFRALSNFESKVILLIYPSSSTGILERKLLKIMETFCTTMFKINIADNIQEISRKDMHDYEEFVNLLDMNTKELTNFLQKVKDVKFIEYWKTFLWKQKLTYESLNKMEMREHFIISEVYVPQNQIERLSVTLGKIMPTPSIQELDLTKPPTAFNTNAYTRVAQEITDTYGVPRYQEVNPSIFTTVTFPFFFGVMFGDIAHGAILFIVGLLLIFKNDTFKKGSMKFFSQLRYMVTMMGFFAFYCGWIYNDFLGMNVNIFGSCYNVPPPPSEEDKTESLVQLRPISISNKECIYPFGIDPAWGRANNELVYVNSLKMKISVIIAIIHMAVGVIIKAYNSVYFKKKLDFIFEFIPQFILLVGLFGYMDFLIVYKWLKDWRGLDQIRYSPSIIGTMMDIGLKTGKTQPHANMWGNSEDTSQDFLQLIILVVAFLCIPLMLLPKPIIEIKKMNKIKAKENPLLLSEDLEDQREKVVKKINKDSENQSDLASEDKNNHNEHGQMDSSEIFVHQLIETIEFVLGAVSNTASYLRLWALSLAHSQLAKVFFDKSLKSGYEVPPILGIVALPLFFYILCWVTFGVLMCMDTMQCFLHSLRLHWVEFQNKFYKGDGYKFEPLSLSRYLNEMKSKEVQE